MTGAVRGWQPILLLTLAGLAPAASAETMSVTESASYAMSDEETRTIGRQHCIESAKHSALDRAGSVFEAELTNESSEAGKDEARLKMRSYFAGVVSSQMVGDHVDIDQTGRAIETCTVQIGYDPETVSAKMRDIADAEGLRKQLAQQQSTIAALQDQVKQTEAFTAPPQMAAAYAPPVAAPQVYYPPASAYSSPPPPASVVASVRPAYVPAAPVPVYAPPPTAYVVAAPRIVVAAPPIYYAPLPVLRPIAVRPFRLVRAVHHALFWRR